MNDSASPLALWATIDCREGVVCEEDLATAAAAAWKDHPYLRAAVSHDPQGIIASEEGAIPLTVEALDVTDCSSEHEEHKAVRGIIQRELAKGVCITKAFARLHTIFPSGTTSPHHTVHLLVIGDHMAFDGRSFFAVLRSVIRALPSATPPTIPETEGSDCSHELCDWNAAVPASLELPPYDASAFDPRSAISTGCEHWKPEEGTADPPAVRDVVWAMDSEIFSRLRREAKTRQVSLNGPMAVALRCAVADAAIRRGTLTSDTLSLPTLLACAVDVRGLLEPPLPANYVCSAASLMNVGHTVKAGMELWDAAVEESERVAAMVEAREPFRMQSLMRSGDFSSIGALFNVSAIWSNIGRYPYMREATDAGYTIRRLETHVMGVGSNPLLTVHAISTDECASFSFTFSPKYHEEAAIRSLIEDFARHLKRMAEGVCVYEPTV